MQSLQATELADARQGTLYFLGKLNVTRKPDFDVGLISNFVTGTSILTDLKSASSDLLQRSKTGTQVVEGFNRFTGPVVELTSSFFDDVHTKIIDLFGEGSTILEWAGEFLLWAASTFAGSLGDIIPGWGYVQDAADLYDGIKKGILNAHKWLSQVYRGWGVSLLDGGPEIIANGIMQHHIMALAGGLKDVAVTSAKIGLHAAGDAVAGVGSIVGAVTGFLQRIVNLLCYAIQRFLINRSFNQAKISWETNDEIKKDHDQFNKWFRLSVTRTPVIAALMMQSGLVANPIKFLCLLNGSDEVIKQDKYDKGVRYIEELKKLSRDYILGWEDSYKLEFSGLDNYVSGILNNLRSQPDRELVL